MPKRRQVFDPTQFKPTKFHTAAEKAWFGDQLVTFVSEGFPRSMWTKKFYRQLSNTFGMIAHYDQAGFWDAQFSDSGRRVEFVKQLLAWPCYGDPEFTFSDVERAVQKELRDRDVLTSVEGRHIADVTLAETAERDRLVAKYGPGDNG